MESFRWWRYFFGIGILVFNAFVFTTLLLTGSNALRDCLPPNVVTDYGGCLGQLAVGKLIIVLWPWGNILLIVGFVVTFVWPRIVERRGGNPYQSTISRGQWASRRRTPNSLEDPLPPVPSHDMDPDDPGFEPPPGV